MKFRIDPDRPLAGEFERLAGEAGENIVRHLGAAREDHAEAVHEARKSIKKLRALLRLVRAAAPAEMAGADRHFRDVARMVAGAREATAAVETLDRLIAARPKKAKKLRLDDIRAELVRRRDAIADSDIAAGIEGALSSCGRSESLLRAIPFRRIDATVVSEGMTTARKRWARALKAARRRGEPDDFHDLRKAVKAYGAQIGLLRDCLPGRLTRRRGAVEELGETLGELNDIHVMRDALASGTLSLPGDIEISGFTKHLDKTAKAASKEVVEEAGQLLDRLPKKPGKRLRATTGSDPSPRAPDEAAERVSQVGA